MITLQKLHYIVTVAQYGSFHKAARALYISQPSLSAAIREVENDLNIKLFTRTNRGVTVTLAGMEFLPYAHQALQAVAFIENRYRSGREGPDEWLTVSCHHNAIVASVLTRLQERIDFPSWYVHYNEMTTLDILSSIREGQADVGVVCINKLGTDKFLSRVKQFSLDAFPLMESVPYIIVRRDHPLAARKELYFSFDHGDLEKYPFVAYYQGVDGLIEFAEEFVDLKNSSRAERAVYVNDRGAKLDFLLSGDFYTSGIPFCGGQTAPLLTNIPIINRQNMVWYSIRDPDRPLTVLGQLFMDYLREEITAVSRI